jgi:hypothetical protein
MKFVKNVFDWGNKKELVIVDIIHVKRCYACGGEITPDEWHPTLFRCEAGHTVEIPCDDWFIIFTIREKREIKIKKNMPSGKTSVGRGSWIPETETDSNLKFNEQLLKFDYLHEINEKELFGVYFTDLVNAVIG